jgi:hypothetical protein
MFSYFLNHLRMRSLRKNETSHSILIISPYPEWGMIRVLEEKIVEPNVMLFQINKDSIYVQRWFIDFVICTYISYVIYEW